MTECYLVCDDLKPHSIRIPLGTVTDITKRIDVKTSATPMPTQDSSKTFCIDTGGTMKLDVSIVRINGQDGMSNASWVSLVNELADRWQAVTDGCTFECLPSDDNADEYDTDILNVYIDGFKYDYSAGEPSKLTASINLKVGTMFGKNIQDVTIPNGSAYIQISDSTGNRVFNLYDGGQDMNCVESCIMEGGSDNAFEFVTLTIPKKRLESFAEYLVTNNDIIPGRNLLTVKAHGVADFVVTRCKLRDTTYTITGYAKPEMFRGTATSRGYGHGSFNDKGIPESGGVPYNDTPWETIQDILRVGVSFGTKGLSYTDEDIITNVDKTVSWAGDVFFPEKSNAWYVMQVCALKLGAKIWFSERKCYIMDVTKAEGFTITPDSTIELYPSTPTEFSEDIVGNTDTGDEGKTSIVNIVDATYSDITGKSSTTVVLGPLSSREYYGEMRGSVTVREVFNTQDIIDIANGMMMPLLDSQTSIRFRVRDTTKQGWRRIYTPTEYAKYIVDSVADITVSYRSHSDQSTRPGLLMPSLYRYCYPDNFSEYTWGVQQSVDLSQTISQIKTALSR